MSGGDAVLYYASKERLSRRLRASTSIASKYNARYTAAVVAGGGGGAHSLTRSTSGILFYDDFNRADGAPGGNWSDVSGTWVISSNNLTDSSPGNFHSVVNSFSHGYGVYEARIKSPTSGGYGGLRCMIQSITDDYHVWVQNNGGGTSDDRWAYGGTGDSTITSGSATVSGSSYHVVKLDIATTRDAYLYYDHGWKIPPAGIGGRFHSGAGPTTAGTIGFFMYSSAPLIDWVLVSSNTTLTVTGLSTGYGFRLLDPSDVVIGSSGAQSGGTATLDLALLVDGLTSGYLQVYSDQGTWSVPVTGGRYPSSSTASDIVGGDSYAFS